MVTLRFDANWIFQSFLNDETKMFKFDYHLGNIFFRIFVCWFLQQVG